LPYRLAATAALPGSVRQISCGPFGALRCFVFSRELTNVLYETLRNPYVHLPAATLAGLVCGALATPAGVPTLGSAVVAAAMFCAAAVEIGLYAMERG